MNVASLLHAVTVTHLWRHQIDLGWRGFAQPRLQERYNALIAAVIVGVEVQYSTEYSRPKRQSVSWRSAHEYDLTNLRDELREYLVRAVRLSTDERRLRWRFP